MASGVRQRSRHRPRREHAGPRRYKYWPIFALLPILVVGQVKATGFNTIVGVDTTVLSLSLVIAATGLTFLRYRRYPFRKMLPYFLFALVVLFGVARSDPGWYQAVKARDFFLLTSVVVVCVPVLLRDMRDLRGLLAVWFSGGVFVATMVLVVGGAEDLYGRAGIGETTLGPAYLAAGAVVVGGTALGERLLPLAVALPGMAVGGVALAAIGSRGPVIAAVVGLVVWVLLRGVLRARTTLVMLLVLVIAWVGVNQASDSALARFVLEDPARRTLWAEARLTFLEAPLLGMGWGDFSTYSSIDQYPHNLVFEAASELGVVGLVVVMALLVTACLRVWRSRSEPAVRAIAALAIAMLVGQQFSSDLTNRLFWIAVIPCLLLPLPNTALSRTDHEGGSARGSRPGSAP